MNKLTITLTLTEKEIDLLLETLDSGAITYRDPTTRANAHAIKKLLTKLFNAAKTASS